MTDNQFRPMRLYETVLEFINLQNHNLMLQMGDFPTQIDVEYIEQTDDLGIDPLTKTYRWKPF